MQQQERLIALIEKYQANTCTDAEIQELEAWYTAYNSQMPLSGILNKEAQQTLKDELLQAIRQEIRQENTATPRRGRYRHIWRSAAAVIICGGLTYAMYKWVHGSFLSSPEIVFTEITTPRGKTMKILLPDSSKVWLNADSKIKYAEKFDAKERTVYLVGEAFFDIKQDAKRSFVVHTREIATQVLGTSFNISNYKGAEIIAVTVLQGKVRVAKTGTELGIVLPDQQVSYNTATGSVSHQKTDATAYSSWKDGWLVFKDQPFQEIVTQLQRKFDITIEIKDPALARCRFTASFAPGTDLPKLLNLLCRINHSNYQLMADINKVIIQGKGCN